MALEASLPRGFAISLLLSISSDGERIVFATLALPTRRHHER